MMVLPEEDWPKSLLRSTVMVRTLPLTENSTFFTVAPLASHEVGDEQVYDASAQDGRGTPCMGTAATEPLRTRSGPVHMVPSHGGPGAAVQGHLIAGHRLQVSVHYHLGHPAIHGRQTPAVRACDHLDPAAAPEAVAVLADTALGGLRVVGPRVVGVLSCSCSERIQERGPSTAPALGLHALAEALRAASGHPNNPPTVDMADAVAALAAARKPTRQGSVSPGMTKLLS